MTHDRLAPMIVAITLGETLEHAILRGIVKTPEERVAWARLADDIAAIEARGGQVDIPVEPLV